MWLNWHELSDIKGEFKEKKTEIKLGHNACQMADHGVEREMNTLLKL